MQTGFDCFAKDWCKTHTVDLEDGERVIGFKSREFLGNPNIANHCDFQLIIGHLV